MCIGLRLLALYRPVAYEAEAPRVTPGGGWSEGVEARRDPASTYLARNIGDILHSVHRAALLKRTHEKAVRALRCLPLALLLSFSQLRGTCAGTCAIERFHVRCGG